MCDLTSCSHFCPTIHIDVKTTGGWTAADAARQCGHRDIAELLTNYQSPPRCELQMLQSCQIYRLIACKYEAQVVLGGEGGGPLLKYRFMYAGMLMALPC